MNPDELTEVSFKELIKITKLFNIHGLTPIVVGGWAVYYYTKREKSVDIDLVFPSKNAIQIFEKHFKQQGFKKEKQAKIRELFKKEVETRAGKQEIEIDIFTLQNKNRLASDKSIEIPWKLSEKYGKEWQLEKDVTARVPEKEVLLLYKAAALVDRQFKLKNWINLSRFVKDRLKAKIEKDKRDIGSLLALEIDEKKLALLLKETGFEKQFNKITKELKE
ncbi:MAG: nucleotidyltransferase [archaeon]